MLTFYPVELEQDLPNDHPLHIGKFFKLKGMHWRTRKKRQGLIISVAFTWRRLIKKNLSIPKGFIEEETFLTNLTRQVGDAKVIIENFFEIKRRGYSFNSDNRSPTLIAPKKLSTEIENKIDALVEKTTFVPEAEPINKNLVKSEVIVRHFQQREILHRLKLEDKLHLIAPVRWLFLQKNPITFYYEPAGRLMLRDKSIWPIRAIELWPGWLRRDLFGATIDIEGAYVQFVLTKLREKHHNNMKQLELKYPDILKMFFDKDNFRKKICESVFRLEPIDENIKVVKKLLMSLANGSNVTSALLLCNNSQSEAARIIQRANPRLTREEKIFAGKQMSKIAKQLKAAKRELCFFLLGERPTRSNQKLIFTKYLEWERQSRYKMWEAVGFTGVNAHDGLDGIMLSIPSKALGQQLFEQHGLMVDIKLPNSGQFLKVCELGT